MPVPQLPPEAFRFTRSEIDNLTTFDERKELGGLIVRSNEPVKATGWDPDRGEDELIIPAGSMEAVILHAPHTTGLQQFQHSLALAGSYVALHQELRERPHVVGITFEPLARFAVRAAGFSHIRAYGPDEAYQTRLEAGYGKMRLSSRRPFRLAMVHMFTTMFIESFANPRLGRDPRELGRIVGFSGDNW